MHIKLKNEKLINVFLIITITNNNNNINIKIIILPSLDFVSKGQIHLSFSYRFLHLSQGSTNSSKIIKVFITKAERSTIHLVKVNHLSKSIGTWFLRNWLWIISSIKSFFLLVIHLFYHSQNLCLPKSEIRVKLKEIKTRKCLNY